MQSCKNYIVVAINILFFLKETKEAVSHRPVWPATSHELVRAPFSWTDYRFISFYFAQQLNPSHTAEQHPSEKGWGVGGGVPMPPFYPFSSTHLFPPPFIQEGLFP